ncbi:sugar efflux transporter for intercellular exchange domain-containing protein [Ditylenchus destructor]|uniref:Sugar transporter SWEET n=1 Tax=Ditylenchus destructor TaxID=166010 RepID=A0AAD4R3U4_9BILA|nr:sugar efflux transporter for intercellular exchange domain-containing protein [Ditylenchus destructor]
MDLLALYTLWLTTFSISFTFMPLFVVLDWKRRGTAEGFSSVNFVLPLLMMSCWARHGFLTDDKVNIFINVFNLFFMSMYVLAFAYYQPKRRYLFLQLSSLAVTLLTIFTYVNSHPAEAQPDKMGAIAAATQIVGLAGGVYDIKRAISLGTTEYIPATIQFGILGLTVQWALFGIWVGNYYITIANVAGLIVNLATLALYFVYPPKTWRVPIFGMGGEEAKKKKL